MPDSFNPYQTWLGLPESATAPNYFELLDLDESETDSKAIAAAADRAASKVRRCRPGEHSAEWAALLDEIATAKRTLMDSQARERYLQSQLVEDDTTADAAGPRPGRMPVPAANPDLFPPATPSRTQSSSAAEPPRKSARQPAGERNAQVKNPAATAPASAASKPFPHPATPQPTHAQPDPMQPAPSPLDQAMSPAGVPYLQPAPAHAADPMQPADLAMSPYLPPTSPGVGAPTPYAHPMAPLPHGVPPATPGYPAPQYPMAPNPMAPNPMAPNPMAPNPMAANPMAADPMAAHTLAPNPMAAIPVAMPLGQQPYAGTPNAPAAPYAPMTPGGSFPGHPVAAQHGVPQHEAPQYVGQAAGSFPGAGVPLAAAPVPASAQPGAPGTPAVNRASAAMLAKRHTRSNNLKPVLLGAGVGSLLVAIMALVYYFQFYSGGDQLAAGGDTAAATATSPSPVDFAEGIQNGAATPDSSGGDDWAKNAGERSSSRRFGSPPPPASVATSELSPLVTDTTTPKTFENDFMPADEPDKMMPEKPAPATATPAPDTPAPEPVDLPEPTAAELAKLGLAMKKTRESVGDHDFDKAAAFLELAAEMPRRPEHQAMLDRLSLLADCVSLYRNAIETGIAKFESGATFKVGDVDVAVVETGYDKIIVRANGQNRRYTVSELPMGLAAAIAAQTLAPDDSNTLLLKGAYVLSHPQATADELKKAREFLETASGSKDEAKELLVLMDESYDLK